MTGADDPRDAPITAADIRWAGRRDESFTDGFVDFDPSPEPENPTAVDILVRDERQLRYRIWELEAQRDAYQRVARVSLHHNHAQTIRIRDLCAEIEWLRAQNRALRAPRCPRPGAPAEDRA